MIEILQAAMQQGENLCLYPLKLVNCSCRTCQLNDRALQVAMRQGEKSALAYRKAT